MRAHAGQQIFQAGVDRIFDGHGIAGTKQYAADQIERLLAAVGDEDVVAGPGERLPASLFHEVPPQGFIAAGGAELQNGAEVRARQHGLATGAEIVQREEGPRRPGHDETGHLVAESAGRSRG